MGASSLDRITIDPAVCKGQPTIRGVRITVGVVLKMLAGGASVGEVLEAYPDLDAISIGVLGNRLCSLAIVVCMHAFDHILRR